MAGAPLTLVLRRLCRTFEATGLRHLPDALLLKRFVRERDQAAFATLVQRHGPLVLAACRQVLADEADVEDAFQATFLVLLRRAGSVEWRASVGSWLYGVAHRVAVRARAGSLRRRQVESRAADRRPGEEAPPDLSWREAVGILHEELDRMPDKFRLPLLLCYLDGKSRDEASALLGWPPGAVKGRLERGRNLLRQRLTRRGMSLAVGLGVGAAAAPATGAVPAALVDSTWRTLTVCLDPGAAASGAAAHVSRLAHGALRTMTLTPSKPLLAILTLTGILALGVGVTARPAPVEGPKSPTPAAPAPGPGAEKLAAKPGGQEVAVRGQVQGPDGKPLAGARIFLPVLPPGKEGASEEETLKHLETPVRATTGADGKFQFTLNLAPGARCKFLQARADGYGPDQLEFAEPPPATVEGTLRLAKDDVPIRGRVLDLEGHPVANVQASLMDVEVPAGDDLDAYLKEYKAFALGVRGKTRHVYGVPPLTQPVSAGADGRFTVRGVGRDRIAVLSLEAPGVEKMLVRVLTRPDVDVKSLPKPGRDAQLDTPTYPPTFDHLVSPTRLIVGTVREQGTGKPLAGVRVVGMVMGKNVRASTVTDAEGKYRLTGLSKAPKRPVLLYPPDTTPYLGAAREVADTEGLGPQTADFTLARGVVVTGRVLDQATGKPTRGFVRYVPVAGNESVKDIPDPGTRFDRTGRTTGPDGKFRLVVLRGPGILMVQGVGEHGFRLAGPPPDPKEKELLNLAPDGHFITAYGDVEFISNEHGLRVINPGKDTESLRLDFTLDPGRTARVKVMDPDGKPVTGVTVTGLKALEVWGAASPQSAAEFPVHALDPAKPRRLVLWHWKRKLVGHALVRGDEPGPVEVRLAPAGCATGRLVDADGKPLAEAVVRYGYRDARYQRIRPEFYAESLPLVVTDKEGRFRLEGLVPDLGTYAALEPATKGQKFYSCLRPVKELLVIPTQKAVAWKVRPGVAEELGDVLVQPIKE